MSTSLTLEEFTDITLEVNQEGGIGDYQPALALPDTKRIQTIEGIPGHVAHTEAIQKVIARSGFEERSSTIAWFTSFSGEAVQAMVEAPIPGAGFPGS